MAVAGTLTVVLNANLDQLKQALNDANDYTAGFSRKSGAQLDALKAKIDPVGAAAKKMGQEIATADKFFAAGALSAEEHAVAVELARAAYDRLTESLGKTAVAEAAEITFSRARLAVLEEGGAKIGIFGSALEALGPLGIAGAAGLAALGVAAEKARQAMEWSSELEKQSRALGVTTTSLQQLDYANTALGVGVDQGRQALSGFNDVFGKYSAGLANGRVAKFLDALGFTPESAREVGDVSQALDKVLPKLAEIQNPSQRAALANALGLQAFLPLLSEGAEGVERLTAAMKEAQENGSVISPFAIAQAAEMNEKVEALQYKIGQDLRKAFIDLAPEIENVAEVMESLVGKMAKVLADIPNFLRGIQAMIAGLNLRGALQQNGLTNGLVQLDDFLKSHDVGHVLDLDGHLEAGLFGQTVASGRALDLRQRAQANILGGKPLTDAERKAFGPDEGPAARGVDLSQPGKPKRGPPDQTADLDKTAQSDLDSAQKDYADAVKAATAAVAKIVTAWTIADRQVQADSQAAAEGAAQRQAIDADLAKKLDGIADEELKVRASKNDAHRAEQLQILAAARAREIDAAAVKRQTADTEAAAKKEQAARDAQIATIDQQAAVMKDDNATQAALNQAGEQLARTTQERLAYAQRLITDQQTQSADDIDNRYDRLRVGVDPNTENGQRRLTELQQQQDAERANLQTRTTAQRAVVNHQYMSPLEAWADQAPKNAKEIGEALETYAVKGMNDFNSGAAQAIAQGQSLGDVLKKTFQDAETALISYLLKQAEIGVLTDAAGVPGLGFLSGLLPHNATGTDSFGGGATHLNEQGPEGVAFLPKGTQIIPNDIMRQLARGVPQRAAPTGPAPINLAVNVDAGGAFSFDHVQQAVKRGVVQAVSLSSQAAPGRMQSYNLLGT